MPVIHKKAIYREKTAITVFIGNPLIACLPDSEPQDTLLKGLLKLPPYKEEYRMLESQDRLNLLTMINTVHITYAHDLFIARSLSRCILWGYVARNPMPFEVTLRELQNNNEEITDMLENYLTKTVFPTFGFTILGISGVGKSCSVLNALYRYPQIIEHTEYSGTPFNCTQLVWLKVDCPGDGSPKGLCTAILQQLDKVLGTSYASEVTNRTSKDVLTSKVSQCLLSHHLGVLVIDDIQNLCGTKKDTTSDLLSFFIYLMETLAIPVVMVGTPKVLPLFQAEFQIAKRATGDGTVRMGLLEKNSREWERFISGIWRYQFTAQKVPLTSEMKEVFYRESVGNPFLCSLLYKLVQDDAITSSEETFTPQDVKKVASDKLGITTRMRKRMLEGDDEELRRYEFLWEPATLPPINDASFSNPFPVSKPDKDQEVINYITEYLVKNFKITIKEAIKTAYEVITAEGNVDKDQALNLAIELCKATFEFRQEKSEKEQGSSQANANEQ